MSVLAVKCHLIIGFHAFLRDLEIYSCFLVMSILGMSRCPCSAAMSKHMIWSFFLIRLGAVEDAAPSKTVSTLMRFLKTVGIFRHLNIFVGMFYDLLKRFLM